MTARILPFEVDRDGVAVLTLSQPDRPVVVLDWALLRAINATLDRIGPKPKGFVLASDSRVFVAGADLKEIVALDHAQLDEYLAFGQFVYGRIAQLPCTTVAAINGAALGGGLEIAMHCDHLIALRPVSKDPAKGSKPYAIGLPEAGLSICPGWGGTNMLPARMDPAEAIERTATGRVMTVFEASERGLIEEIVDTAEELIPRAKTMALRAKKSPRTEPIAISNPDQRDAATKGLEVVRSKLPKTQAAEAVVQCVEAGLRDGWQAALKAERDHLNRLRATEEGKKAIQTFFEKSAAR